MGTNGFEDIAKANTIMADFAGQHRSAGDENARDIEPGSCHQHARDDLVAAGDENNRIKLVCHHHDLNAVGNHIAADQGVFHARMIHRNPVTDCDGREFERDAAGIADPRFDCLRQGPQMDMSGDDFIKRIDHTDKRLFHFIFRQAEGIEQGPVGGTARAFLDRITAHRIHLLCY